MKVINKHHIQDWQVELLLNKPNKIKPVRNLDFNCWSTMRECIYAGRRVVLAVLFLFSMVAGHAQSTANIIRGRVVDKADKSPIIGATIIEFDTNNRIINGATTDVNGDFVLKLRDVKNKVKITVIGYTTKDVPVSTTKSIVVEMVSEDVEISEVTITAKSQSSDRLTNIEDRDKASSSVKIELMEMKDLGVISAADALQGKISGLDILSASGDPGSGSQLVIRGLSSMGNSRPLIVIDGIPQFRVGADFNLSSADQEDISNLVNLPLQDIKSIEVLKDAASQAVYGSQGADGVLLIETYKGKMGKVTFDYQYKNSINFQPKPIPMLNGDEYIMLQIEQWHNRYGIFELPREIAYDRDYDQFFNYSQNTDWVGAITKTAVTHDHYFGISGGGEKTRYYTSFSYVDEGGTTINTSSKRFSSRVNLDYFLSKNLVFSILFNYSNQQIEGNYVINNRNIRQMAYIKAPNMSIWDYDSNGERTGEYFSPIQSYQGDGISYFNPVAVAELGNNNQNNTDLENSFKLRYTINDWLIFNETVSFQYNGSKKNRFLPYNAIGADWLNWQKNYATEENNMGSSIKTETNLSFNSPFKNKDYQVYGAVSWITNQSGWEYMQVQTNRIASVDIQDPSIAGPINWMGSGNGMNRDLGALLNLNLKFFDRYMLQTIVRADAYSAFGSNNRWGVFQGISAGWRFSDEPIIKHWEWLGDSKLRASYGVTGKNPNDAYARYATYSTASPSTYIVNPAIVPTQIQLDNLRWSSISATDIGLELNMFNDRVFFEFDYYNKVTHDILNKDYRIPTSSGYDKMLFYNGGTMQNTGWEVMMNTKIIKKKDIIWSVDFNTSQNVNKFLELPDNFNTEKSTDISNGKYPQRIMEGEAIGSFFGFRYKGVYASDEEAVARDANNNVLLDGKGSPIIMTYKGEYQFKGGDAIYEDINHDGQIDLNDVVHLGDCNPDFIGGISTSLKYKNFNFSMSFHYRVGFDIINGVAIETQGMNDRNNQSKAVLRRWRVQGQSESNILPRAYMGHQANNLGSNRYVEEGDFMRLNDIKLSYRMKKEICQMLHVNSINLSVSARKLLTFTKYTGQDPEVGMDASDPFAIGIDYAKTPPPRMLTFSAAVNF